MAIDTDEAVADATPPYRPPGYGLPVHERWTTSARQLPCPSVQRGQGGNLLTLVTIPPTALEIVVVHVQSASASVRGIVAVVVAVAVAVAAPDVAVAVGVTSAHALLVCVPRAVR